MTDKRPLLSVRGLTVEFGSFTAVDDVSFDLYPGDSLAIVGESGSGKSVTALSIMRLIELSSRGRITAGQILLDTDADGTGNGADGAGDGRSEPIDLVTTSEEELRSIRGSTISMIFQEPLTALNPVYSIGNQVAEAVLAHRDVSREEAKSMALEMLQRVRMPEAEKRLKQYPHEMSGGMRQRVMIAQALMLSPRILICDEPTTALDVTIQSQILRLIRDLQDDTGAAVIMITHDMGVVAETADRVVVMKDAKVVEQGPVEQIFSAPTQPYTRALLAAVPKLNSMSDRDEPAKFDLIEEQL